MKFNIRHFILGLGMLLSATSCDSFLDVKPDGEMLGKELLTTRKGFENALYGTYATMRSSNLYGQHMSFYTMDILAQYFDCQGNSTVLDLTRYNYYSNTDVKGIILSIWFHMYENISYINNILHHLEGQSPASLKFHDIYKGEALGLRAFMHFDLLRLFCTQENGADARGIVYSRDFSQKPSEILPKAKIWEYILQDLLEAERLLDNPELYAKATPNDNYLKDQVIHFNLHAVRATLARVYITKGDYAEALAYARKVIGESGHSLTPKEKLKASNGCISVQETIFGLYDKSGWYNMTKDYLYNNTSFRSLSPNRMTESRYTGNEGGHDYRWDFWFQPIQNMLRLVRLTETYQSGLEGYPEGIIPGINMLRLPEMYYIAAECLLREGNASAKDYFNAVLESRGLNPVENLTLGQITEERYKEFIGEGQSFFNMKRLNLDILTITGETVPASNDIYVLRIPDEEFNYRN